MTENSLIAFFGSALTVSATYCYLCACEMLLRAAVLRGVKRERIRNTLKEYA